MTLSFAIRDFAREVPRRRAEEREDRLLDIPEVHACGIGCGQLADEFALLRFVEDVLARLELSGGDQEPVAEVVEVSDIGQGQVSRRGGHAVAHLERRAVREGRAEHLRRRHLRTEGEDDALGQHFGLA